MVEILGEEEEAVRVGLLNWLVFVLLQQQTHDLSHDDLVLLHTAVLPLVIVVVIFVVSAFVLPLCHNRDHALDSLKQNGVLISMGHLQTFQ